MPTSQDVSRDDTVTFLPHRLNRQPVVVRGLTADELWVCVTLSGALGLIIGIPLAWIFSTLAFAPTMIVACVAAGVFIGGGVLRRHKRGRPDIWLYRQIQWWIARRLPSLAPYTGGHFLITRSGYWVTRRSAS
ncbi:MAG: TIGR03750 family conjugal transfer protein [Nitrospiraceae bacterium]